MIEVYVGGNICYESDMALELLFSIMTDDFIGPDDFIEIGLSDGCKAYIRKKVLCLSTVLQLKKGGDH